MATSIPDIGDDVALRRLVRQAIERVRAMDIPEADKEAWVAYIEAQYRRASALRLAHDPRTSPSLFVRGDHLAGQVDNLVD